MPGAWAWMDWSKMLGCWDGGGDGDGLEWVDAGLEWTWRCGGLRGGMDMWEKGGCSVVRHGMGGGGEAWMVVLDMGDAWRCGDRRGGRCEHVC